MRQISLIEEVYQKLDVIKRRVSRTASFNTAVHHMIRKFLRSLSEEDKFVKEIRSEMQTIEISNLILTLRREDLVSDLVSDNDLLVLIKMLINNNWLNLDSFVHQKANFIREALEKREKNLKKVVDDFPGVMRVI